MRRLARSWLPLAILAPFLAGPPPATAQTVYTIQAAINDEWFIINDEKYQAKTYCLGWDEGDRVIFEEGSANGICVSAMLYNIDRDQTCRVWCE